MNIEEVRARALREIEEAKDVDALRDVRIAYLGRQRGEINALVKGIKDLSEEERRATGPLVQALKREVEETLEKRERALGAENGSQERAGGDEFFFPLFSKVGHLHPLTRTVRRMNAHFMRLGYSVMDGPEIENDEYCFRRLNVPENHPARDLQDTIYIQEPKYLLRTHTSSIETRVLASFKPPFKVVCPGRVYRNEKVNRSNHFIFHHYQGFVVLEEVSLKDLFGTLTSLFRMMYGKDVVIRFRNKYYPEVEPGVGPDMQCFSCKGKGCALCKGVGWIEMGGAGIIHPFIMRTAGIDPRKWRGFAFGLGLDRWVMARYGITDIRTLLGGNLAYKYHINENTLRTD